VSIDVVCAGPVYLDVTFEGLESLPAAGEERFARDLHTTPGGAAITAIGLVRLGLSAAVVAPLGVDFAGTLLQEQLEAAGVVCAGPRSGRTPVTVVLPIGDERAFATFEPPGPVDPATISRLRPRAVVSSLDEPSLAPQGARLYASVGQRTVDRDGPPPPGGARIRAVVANRDEAMKLTRAADAEAAALALAERAETAVVTCGADGAVAATAGEVVAVPAPRVEVRDTTGAGDLFMAAYVWGDLADLPLEERLRRAAVYAALSVRTATGAGSAATLQELERAIAELDPAIMHEYRKETLA
jgi:sugar/nucleoside kinase (ribokinase family)